MNELYLPKLPEFKVANVEIDGNQVNFELVLGVLSVDCLICAVSSIKSFEVNDSLNPEKCSERDFKCLSVDVNTPVEVMRSDLDIHEDQKLQLTEVQVKAMNEILDDMMEVV